MLRSCFRTAAELHESILNSLQAGSETSRFCCILWPERLEGSTYLGLVHDLPPNGSQIHSVLKDLMPLPTPLLIIVLQFQAQLLEF